MRTRTASVSTRNGHCFTGQANPMRFTFCLLLYILSTWNTVLVTAMQNPSINGNSISIAFDEQITQADRKRLLQATQTVVSRMIDILHEATDGYISISTLNLLIPQSWHYRGDMNAVIRKSRSQYAKDADMIVHMQDKVFNNEPTTVQFAGCGKPGLRIDLSQEFLLKADNTADTRHSDTLKAKTLLRQWMHYRYGVFDEHGFIGDAMYPTHYSIPGTDDIKVTSCASRGGAAVQPDIISRDSSNSGCKLSVSNSSGLPMSQLSGCSPKVDFGANADITSSLMYEPHLDSVRRFCDQNTHNSEAPNKQNLLCEGKSVWEVLSEHPDLKEPAKQRNYGRKAPLIVNTIEMDAPRIYLMADILANRTTTMKIFVKKFINELPKGRMLTYVEYTNITSVDSWKDEPNFGGHPPITGICLSCGLDKVMNLHDDDKERKTEASSSRTDVILITEGRIVDDENTTLRLVEQLKERNIKLKVIIYPFVGSDHSKLETLVSNVNGELITIQESIEGKDIKTTTLAKLYDTFDAINEWNENKPLLLNKDTFDTRSSVNFSFSVDQSIVDANSDLYVYVLKAVDVPLHDFQSSMKLHSNNINDIQNFRSLKTEEVFKKLRSHGFYLNRTALRSRVGQMTLSLSFPPSTTSNDKFFAAAVAIPEYRSRMITAECWLSNATDTYALYAFVHKDYNEFVRDAKVTQVIEDESGNIVESSKMFDDGNGDPDITKGDGIYSRYITNVEFRKRYSASIIVQSQSLTTDVISRPVSAQQCCGSSVIAPAETVSHLTRIVHCGTFFVNENLKRRWEIMGVINTLSIIDVVEQSVRKIHIQFKIPFAAGASLQFRFKFFRAEDADSIRKDFDNTKGNESQAWVFDNTDNAHYGDLKTLILPVPFKEAGRFYFAIKTSHLNQKNVYRISNIVSFEMAADPSLVIEGNAESSSVTDSYVTDTYSDSLNVAGMQIWQIIAVIAGSLIVFVLIFLLIISFVWGAKRRRDDQRSKHPKISTPVLTVDSKSGFANKINNEMINVSGKQPLTDNEAPLPELSTTVMSPISDVQSWSADVLLDHYGRVQKAKERHEPPPVMRVEDIADNMSSVSNNSKFRESTSDEDNVGNHIPWHQYEQYEVQTPIPQIQHCQPVQYYPNDWRQSFNGRQTPSDYDHRYGVPDKRKGGSAVSQV